MATITLRSAKGSPLTNAEVDGNFSALNNELATKANSSSLASYQPLDGDLSAIAALAGTAGFLKKTAADTWALDTNTYLTSFTETDPTVPSHVKSITATNISNWNTAFGWGNHASAGYLTGITSGQVTTALGYTPYNATNPNGYITSSGSITGSAGSISGFNNPSTSPTANTIVYRDSLGDIAAREIVLSSGLSSQTPTVLVSMYPTTNQLVRTTPAAVSAAIQGAASGTWAISVTGSARSVGLSDPAVGAGGIWVLTSDKTLNFADGVGAQKVMSSGVSAVNSVDVRAPIFYDSNNTAYYIDAAGGSVMSAITLGGQEVYLYSGATNQFNIRTGAGGAYKYFGFDTSGNFTASNGSVYGQRFYDGDNTAYYLDPASTTRINGLNIYGDNPVYPSQWEVRFQSTSDFANGTLVTTDIPATAADGDSFVIEITGKSYDSSNPPFKAVAQGYLYGNGIIAYSGISYGGSFASYIKVFQDGGVLKFWWPRVSYWNSFNVNVMTMNDPTNNTITRNRVTAIGNSTEPTGTKKVQINLSGFMRSDVSATNSVDVRAPVFYDSNNTGYYLDPASTSVLNYVGVAQGNGINFNGAGNAYIKGTSTDNAASGGSNLQLQSWFGIGFGPTISGQLVPAGENAVWIDTRNGDLTARRILVAQQDARAPIFYDNNNTGYYIDAASTSVLNGLNVGTNTPLYSSGSFQYHQYQSPHIAYVKKTGGYSWYWRRNDTGLSGGANEVENMSLTEGGTLAVSGDMRAPIFYKSNDTNVRWDGNALVLRGGSPTVYFRDTDHNSAMIHCNSNLLYVLRGPNDSEAWATVGSGQWPLQINLTNNDAQFGGNVTAIYDMYAGLYYDRNDSAYYVDPNGNTRLRNLNLGGGGGFDATIHIVGVQGGNGRLTQMSPNGASQNAFNIMAARNSGNTDLWWSWGVDTSNQWRINQGVGFAANGIILTDVGNLTVAQNVTAYSDARLKENVETVADALALVGRMRGVTYTRKDTGCEGVGVIAQEMQDVLPQVVIQSSADDDTLSVAYGNIVGVLIEAIKELENKVTTLESRLH